MIPSTSPGNSSPNTPSLSPQLTSTSSSPSSWSLLPRAASPRAAPPSWLTSPTSSSTPIAPSTAKTSSNSKNRFPWSRSATSRAQPASWTIHATHLPFRLFSLPSLFTVCRSTFNFKLSTINSLLPQSQRSLRTAIPGCPLPRGTGQPRPHEKTFMTITANAGVMVRRAENRTGCCGREGGGVYWRSFRKAPQQSSAIPRWRRNYEKTSLVCIAIVLADSRSSNGAECLRRHMESGHQDGPIPDEARRLRFTGRYVPLQDLRPRDWHQSRRTRPESHGPSLL